MQSPACPGRLDGLDRPRRPGRFEEAEIGGADSVALDHDHQTLDHVPQLAHIAGLGVLLECGHGAALETLGVPAILARELGHEIIREQGHILRPHT